MVFPDSEDLTRAELAILLVYHPLLNTEGDLDVPEIGSFVWFSQNSKPRLGKVMSLDPSVSRPVVLQVYEPRKSAAPLPRARFRPAMHADSAEPATRH